jgi:hypothetical protein
MKNQYTNREFSTRAAWIVTFVLAFTVACIFWTGTCASTTTVTCPNGVEVAVDAGGGMSEDSVQNLVDTAVEGSCR